MCWLSVTGAEDGLWDLSHASRKTVFCTLCLPNPSRFKIKSNLFLLFSTHSCPDPPPTAFHRLTLPVPDQTPAGLDTWLLLRKQSKNTPLLRNPHRHFSWHLAKERTLDLQLCLCVLYTALPNSTKSMFNRKSYPKIYNLFFLFRFQKQDAMTINSDKPYHQASESVDRILRRVDGRGQR